MSLLDSEDFWLQPTAAGVNGAFIGNESWMRLKNRIRSFINEFSQNLALYKAKNVNALKG